MDTQKGLPIAMRPCTPMNDSLTVSRATRFRVALGLSLLGLLMPVLEANADVGRALIPLLVGTSHPETFAGNRTSPSDCLSVPGQEGSEGGV